MGNENRQFYVGQVVNLRPIGNRPPRACTNLRDWRQFFNGALADFAIGLDGWALIYWTAAVPRHRGRQRLETSEFQFTLRESSFSLFREPVALLVPPLGFFGLT
jgi:hypothetical protein